MVGLVRLFFNSMCFSAFAKILFCSRDFSNQRLQALRMLEVDVQCMENMLFRSICLNSPCLGKQKKKPLMVVTTEVWKGKRMIEKRQRERVRNDHHLSQEAKWKRKGVQLRTSLTYICLLLKTIYMYICREQCITIWKINTKLHLNN